MATILQIGGFAAGAESAQPDPFSLGSKRLLVCSFRPLIDDVALFGPESKTTQKTMMNACSQPTIPAHYSAQCVICGKLMRGLTERHDADPVASGDCCTWCNRRVVLPQRPSEDRRRLTEESLLRYEKSSAIRSSTAERRRFRPHGTNANISADPKAQAVRHSPLAPAHHLVAAQTPNGCTAAK